MRVGVGQVFAAISLAAVLGLGGMWLHRGTPDAVRDAASDTGPVTRFTHASGLTLDVPTTVFSVDVTAAGLRVQPRHAATLRNPWMLDLEFKAGAAPALADAKTKQLGVRQVGYVLTTAATGSSGGDQHTLTAWTACGHGHVRALWSQQLEPPQDVDLSSAWAILAAVGCGVLPAESR